LAGNLPGPEEPVPQLARPREERPRRGGHLASAGGAHVEATLGTPRGGGSVALRADKALGPSQAFELRHARLVVGEELADRSRGTKKGRFLPSGEAKFPLTATFCAVVVIVL
jgi:hypothetical protein